MLQTNSKSSTLDSSASKIKFQPSSNPLEIDNQRRTLINNIDKDPKNPILWFRLLDFETKAKRSRETLIRICTKAIENIPSDLYRDDPYFLRIHLYFIKLECEEDARSRFEMLRVSGIGKYSKLFYESWFNFEKETGHEDRALKIQRMADQIFANLPPIQSSVSATPLNPTTPRTISNELGSRSSLGIQLATPSAAPPKTPATSTSISTILPTTPSTLSTPAISSNSIVINPSESIESSQTIANPISNQSQSLFDQNQPPSSSSSQQTINPSIDQSNSRQMKSGRRTTLRGFGWAQQPPQRVRLDENEEVTANSQRNSDVSVKSHHSLSNPSSSSPQQLESNELPMEVDKSSTLTSSSIRSKSAPSIADQSINQSDIESNPIISTSISRTSFPLTTISSDSIQSTSKSLKSPHITPQLSTIDCEPMEICPSNSSNSTIKSEQSIENQPIINSSIENQSTLSSSTSTQPIIPTQSNVQSISSQVSTIQLNESIPIGTNQISIQNQNNSTIESIIPTTISTLSVQQITLGSTIESTKPNDQINPTSTSSNPSAPSSNGPTTTAATTVNEPKSVDRKKSQITSKEHERRVLLFKRISEVGEFLLVVNRKPYIRLECIGKGGSSKVYKALDLDMRVRAIKMVSIKSLDKPTIDSYINEIDLLKRLVGRDTVVQLYDSEVNYDEGMLSLVMEHGEIDLSHLLIKMNSRKNANNENFIRLYWQQMLEAVHTIHEERIVHGDLKPANFVCFQGNLKLIDFGIAKAMQNDTTNIVRENQVGTLNYISPEALASPSDGSCLKLGRASDIWSLGCILYQMVYGKPPFAHITSLVQKMMAITNPSHEISFADLPNKPLLQVIQSCLRRNPKERLSIPDLLQHPFLRS